MKKLKIFILVVIGCAVSIACGKDDAPTSSNMDQGYEQQVEDTYVIPAEGCDEILTLKKMNPATIVDITSPGWAVITAEPNVSSYPSIRIIAGRNESEIDREEYAYIVTETTQELRLKLVQKASKKDNPSDEPSDLGYENSTSDNPAYAPGRSGNQ